MDIINSSQVDLRLFSNSFLASIWFSRTRGENVLASDVDLDQSNNETCPLRILLK
jgi:hypothetical protein